MQPLLVVEVDKNWVGMSRSPVPIGYVSSLYAETLQLCSITLGPGLHRSVNTNRTGRVSSRFPLKPD